MAKAAPDRNRTIRSIWGLAKNELMMNEDEVRAVIYQCTGSESMKQCTDKELFSVLCELGRIKDQRNTAPGKATRRQIWKIRQLEEKLGWTDNPKRLRKFMEKYSTVEKLAWLEFEDASKLIESLKKVLKREQRRKNLQENLQKEGLAITNQNF